MAVGLRKFVTLFALVFWGISSVMPPSLTAGDHVVSTSDLQQEILKVSESRQTNLAKVQEFFSSPSAQKALRNSKIDISKIQSAIPMLTDDELARLAAQTDKIQKDVAGGALTNQQITYIIIALATAVVILIIVAA
jgi:hypothetical protein